MLEVSSATFSEEDTDNQEESGCLPHTIFYTFLHPFLHPSGVEESGVEEEILNQVQDDKISNRLLYSYRES